MVPDARVAEGRNDDRAFALARARARAPHPPRASLVAISAGRRDARPRRDAASAPCAASRPRGDIARCSRRARGRSAGRGCRRSSTPRSALPARGRRRRPAGARTRHDRRAKAGDGGGGRLGSGDSRTTPATHHLVLAAVEDHHHGARVLHVGPRRRLRQLERVRPRAREHHGAGVDGGHDLRSTTARSVATSGQPAALAVRHPRSVAGLGFGWVIFFFLATRESSTRRALLVPQCARFSRSAGEASVGRCVPQSHLF